MLWEGTQRLQWASGLKVSREGCHRLVSLAKEWQKMVWFTVKDQGESAGISEMQVFDAAQCSETWPVLCACINTAISSLEELCWEQSNRLRTVCGGQREKTQFWKGMRDRLQVSLIWHTLLCSWIAVQQWVLSSHKSEVLALLTVGVGKKEIGIVRCRVS